MDTDSELARTRVSFQGSESSHLFILDVIIFNFVYVLGGSTGPEALILMELVTKYPTTRKTRKTSTTMVA